MSDKTKQNNIPLIIGIMFAAIGLSVIILSGSPYEMLHKISNDKLIPPLWIWCGSELLQKFLVGYALGTVITLIGAKRICGANEIKAYQGIIFLIILIFLAIAHYPIFFIAEKLFVSVIISILALICSIICICLWTKISFLSTVIMLPSTAWSAYVTFVSARVMLNL